MIVRLILGSEKSFEIDEESPMFVIVRDVFYSGDWAGMRKDFMERGDLISYIDTLEGLEERLASFGDFVYEPVVWSELAEFLKIHAIEPEQMMHATADGLYELALEYADKNQTGTAKEILRYAMRVDKNYAPAYEFYGTLLLEEGDVDGAIKYLNRSIELDPWLIQSYSMLGEAYYNIGKYDKAIEHWEKEIRLSPANTFTYFMLADAYTKLGMLEKAIDILERFRENTENSIIALYELSELYRRLGNESKAKEYESLLLEVDPEKDPNGVEIWSKVHLKKGNYEKVIQTVERIMKSNPDAKHLGLVLAVAYVKTNRIEQAKRLVQELKDDNFWYLYGKKEFFDELLTEAERELCGIS